MELLRGHARFAGIYGVAGFVVAAAYAVLKNWSLPEFCWSTWLAGLVYAWTCVATAFLQIVFGFWRQKEAYYYKKFPFLRRFSLPVLFFAVVAAALCAGYAAFYIYGVAFGFYGLFLSVFAQMEPLDMFGPNGFINSDFFTPVIHLSRLFWPMAVGVLVANWEDFFKDEPWKRILLPAQKEIVSMHIFVLLLPFITLLVWAIFKDVYHSIAIMLLMGLFYLMPKNIGA